MNASFSHINNRHCCETPCRSVELQQTIDTLELQLAATNAQHEKDRQEHNQIVKDIFKGALMDVKDLRRKLSKEEAERKELAVYSTKLLNKFGQLQELDRDRQETITKLTTRHAKDP